MSMVKSFSISGRETGSRSSCSAYRRLAKST